MVRLTYAVVVGIALFSAACSKQIGPKVPRTSCKSCTFATAGVPGVFRAEWSATCESKNVDLLSKNPKTEKTTGPCKSDPIALDQIECSPDCIVTPIDGSTLSVVRTRPGRSQLSVRVTNLETHETYTHTSEVNAYAPNAVGLYCYAGGAYGPCGAVPLSAKEPWIYAVAELERKVSPLPIATINGKSYSFSEKHRGTNAISIADITGSTSGSHELRLEAGGLTSTVRIEFQ